MHDDVGLDVSAPSRLEVDEGHRSLAGDPARGDPQRVLRTVRVPAGPARAPDHPTRRRARGLAVGQHARPVHEQVMHTRRVLVGVLEGRVIGDRRGIEDDDVGVETGPELAASMEREVAGGQGSELPNRLFQRGDALLAHVLAQQPGEVAVRARMRVRLEEDALGGGRPGVRVEAHPGERDLAPDVLLRHEEVDRAHVTVVGDHQVDRRLLGCRPALGGHLGQRHPGERLERVLLEADQEDAVRRARELVKRLPVLRRRPHLLEHPGADRRVLQPALPLLVAALLHPGRHRGVETGRARRVGVHVRRDAQSLGPRVLDAGDDRVELPPVLGACLLQVVDLGRDVGLAGDRDQLVDRLEQVVPFAPQMRDVHSAVLAGFGGQRDQLLRVRVEARCVDEGRADAERPFPHRFGHQLPHPVELGRRRIAVLVAELVNPHGRRADERRDVRRDAPFLHVLEVLAERRPLDLVLDVALLRPLPGLHRVRPGAHRPSLAHHLERHALADVALGQPVLDERLSGPGEGVDEAGRDGEARRVDLGRGGGVCRKIADGGDRVAGDGHVRQDAWRAGAVVYRTAADDGVVVGDGAVGGASRASVVVASDDRGEQADDRDDDGEQDERQGRGRAGCRIHTPIIT